MQKCGPPPRVRAATNSTPVSSRGGIPTPGPRGGATRGPRAGPRRTSYLEREGQPAAEEVDGVRPLLAADVAHHQLARRDGGCRVRRAAVALRIDRIAHDRQQLDERRVPAPFVCDGSARHQRREVVHDNGAGRLRQEMEARKQAALSSAYRGPLGSELQRGWGTDSIHPQIKAVATAAARCTSTSTRPQLVL